MWVISSRKCFLIAMLLAALGVMGSGRSWHDLNLFKNPAEVKDLILLKISGREIVLALPET